MKRGLEEEQPIRVKNSDRGVWLVKVPKQVREVFEVAPEGADLGEIKISQVSSSSNSAMKIRLVVAEAYREEGKPESYDLRMVVEEGKKHVFRGDEQGVEILGKVERRCNLIPDRSKGYNKLLATRKKTIERSKRTDGIVKEDLGLVAPMSMSMSMFEEKEKMYRMDKDKLRRELFKLFNQHDNWSISELRNKTRQPEGFLRDVVNEIAHKVKVGQHQRYELLPQFKNQ